MCVFATILALPAMAISRPNIVVSSYGIENGPITAGKDFLLVVNLTNVEPTLCARAVTSALEVSYPFVMRGLSTIVIGDLCDTGRATVKFPVRVDPSATAGTYPIKIVSNYESITFVQFSSTSTINLYIEGGPKIRAVITDSQPLDIYPGDVATITFTVENSGDFQARAITGTLSASDPIEVKWSKSTSLIPQLNPHQSGTMQFAFEVPKNAEAIPYPLKLELQYIDENSMSHTNSFTYKLEVSPKAMFNAVDEGSEKFYSNQDGRVLKLGIQNIGTETAHEIKVRLLPQFPFSLDASSRYIEEIQVGQREPVEFSVNIDKDATPGTYVMDVLLDFEDSQGVKFQDTAKVVLSVGEKSVIRGVFADYWLVWVIVAIVVIVIVGRRLTKK